MIYHQQIVRLFLGVFWVGSSRESDFFPENFWVNQLGPMFLKAVPGRRMNSGMNVDELYYTVYISLVLSSVTFFPSCLMFVMAHLEVESKKQKHTK